MSIANLGAKVLKEIFTEGLDETTEALGKSAVRNVDTKKIDIDNTDDYVYIAHGGADFEGSPSLAMSGTGEAASTKELSLMGGFNPLGKGTYGYLIEPEGLEEAVRAIKQNQSYGKRYGTRQSRDPKYAEEEQLEESTFKDIRKKHNFEVEKLSKTKKDPKDFLSQVKDYQDFGPDKWVEDSSLLRELYPVIDPDVIKLDKKLTKELNNFYDERPSRFVAREFKYPEFDVAGKVHLFRLKKTDIDAATKAAKEDKTGKLKGLMRQERLPVDLTEVAINKPELLESLGKLDLDADEASINTFLKDIFKLQTSGPKKIDESLSTNKAAGITDKDLKAWENNTANITSKKRKEQLKGRDKRLMTLALEYQESLSAKGFEASKDLLAKYRKAVDEINPIRPIKTMPKLISNLDVVGALGTKTNILGKKKTGILNVNRQFKQDELVESRLDINGYTNHDKWVATVRTTEDVAEDISPTAYGRVVFLKNVNMFQSVGLQKKSLRIATGKEKIPHAVMKGEYQQKNVEEIYEYANSVFEESLKPDSEWIQIGYNPIRAGYFYDRATGLPLEAADEIIQVGNLVLGKNVKKGEIKTYEFNTGGLVQRPNR